MDRFKHYWHVLSENAYHFYIFVTLVTISIGIFDLEKELLYKILAGCIGLYYVILWFAFYAQSQKHATELKNHTEEKQASSQRYSDSLQKYEKKGRYVEAIQLIHNAVHLARDVYWYTESCQNATETERLNFEKTRFKLLLASCLTAYREAFTLVTGVPCRASIKVIGVLGGGDTDMYVRTLVRDQLASQSCKNQDSQEQKQHTILGNTDYKQIFKRQRDFFFSNNLLEEGQSYENSSLPDDGRGVKVYTDDNWPLPYKSALVWPIRYTLCIDDLPNESSLDKERDQTLYGFLTIDCTEKDVFDEKYSVQMGAILADALFPIMQSYRKMNAFESPDI